MNLRRSRALLMALFAVAPAAVGAQEVPASRRADSPAAQATGSEVAASQRPAGGDAVDLVEAFQLGRMNDPTYRAAVAERGVNRATADQTLAAILPSANYNVSNIPTESGTRQVATVTQPIVSFGALATFKQRAPRRAFADATLGVREQDLAARTLAAVVDIIRANEATSLNEARIEALGAQAERASRLFEAGLGTITDAREIQVRYEQALANRFILQGEQMAAQARFRSITGVDQEFALPGNPGPLPLDPVDNYVAAQMQRSPQLAAARQTERISQLETQRIRGSLLPVLGGTATYTNRNGLSDSYVGLSVSAPLNAGTFYQVSAAKASAERALQERRQVEEKARTELERYHALVDGGRRALSINAKAIEAAELSVQANSRSYEGGVRSSVDVVNAIQTLFEVKNAYVTAATTLAVNYLNVQLLAGVPTLDALDSTQAFLLAR